MILIPPPPFRLHRLWMGISVTAEIRTISASLGVRSPFSQSRILLQWTLIRRAVSARLTP